MKKLLLSFALAFIGFVSISAQLDCNQNYSNMLDAEGEAELAIIDLVSNIEFMLTQGTVSYYVFPSTFGTVTSSSDVISLTCENRGLPSFVVEVTSGGNLIENCSGTLVITSPNGGCEGSNPDICGEDGDCLKIISGYFIADESVQDIFAIDLALCEDAMGCGSYSIAYGLASDGANLDFANSISSEDATEYKNPITIFYTDAASTVFLQSYLYVWQNAECILTSSYKTTYELDLTAEAQITPDNFLTGNNTCESVVLALTGINDPEPINFVSSITVNCDNIGERIVWVRNSETGYTLSRVVQILDPLEACGTVLGPGDRLVNYTEGIYGLFFDTEIELNGQLLPRHPGGIGWILNEDDLTSGTNTLHFLSTEFSLNGISTLDLVLGMRMILLDDYDDPIKPVLFDIDQSGYVGINDLITHRELILGINAGVGLPNAYFFNNSYVFPSDFNHFDFENTFTEYSFEADDFETVDFSFLARKVGDVNGTAVPGFQKENQSEVRSTSVYSVTDMEVESGEEFTFEFSYESEAKVVGLLAALVSNGVEFLDWSADFEQVDANINNTNEIRLSYLSNAFEPELNKVVFTITAKATQSGKLIDMLALKSGFPQEVVDEDENVVTIDDLTTTIVLAVANGQDELNIVLYPNPVSNLIQLKSENLNVKEVQIYDMNGQKVYGQSSGDFSKSIDVQDYKNGMYILNVITDRGTEKVSFIKQ